MFCYLTSNYLISFLRNPRGGFFSPTPKHCIAPKDTIRKDSTKTSPTQKSIMAACRVHSDNSMLLEIPASTCKQLRQQSKMKKKKTHTISKKFQKPKPSIIYWVVPPPSNSHHQDYYMFSRESQPKPSFPLLLGGGNNPKYSYYRVACFCWRAQSFNIFQSSSSWDPRGMKMYDS